jgi:hypothetical protein
MQRALQAQQAAELAEAARALLQDHADTNGSSRHGNSVSNGSKSSALGLDSLKAVASAGSNSSSSGSSGSAMGTGTHTPLARQSMQQTSAQPIPLSFASTRQDLDGAHNPPPGHLLLSPHPSPSAINLAQGSNYELGSSFVDGTLSSSPYANGIYTEVLGGELK